MLMLNSALAKHTTSGFPSSVQSASSFLALHPPPSRRHRSKAAHSCDRTSSTVQTNNAASSWRVTTTVGTLDSCIASIVAVTDVSQLSRWTRRWSDTPVCISLPTLSTIYEAVATNARQTCTSSDTSISDGRDGRRG